MKTKVLWVAAVVSSEFALSSFGALDVVERDGNLCVVRDGKTIVESIRLDGCDAADGEAKTSFTTTKDGSRVWNRWCEDPARAIRLEVAARADGAVEITMAGQVPWDAKNRRRAVKLDMPDNALNGKRWHSMIGTNHSFNYGEDDGVFDANFKQIKARFLAVDGLTFDFNPFGPADSRSASVDGWRHVDGMWGVWRVSRRDGGGWSLGCGNEVLTTWGGYLGAKLVIREGTFADYDSIHALRTFCYNEPLDPDRILSFGAHTTGRFHSDGDMAYTAARGYGWNSPLSQNRARTRFVVTGDHSGAYYSCVTGSTDSVYRFAPLCNGWYFFTFAAGNRTGSANRFNVSANETRVLSDAAVEKGTVRRVTVPVHVVDGKLDVKLSGAWSVSVMAIQRYLLDEEDFAISRGTWHVDGYEPGLLHRNCDVKEPVRPAVRDETIALVEPGTEFAETPRMPPDEVELPPPDLPSLAWTKNTRFFRLFNNSSSLGDLDAPGALDAYFDNEIKGRGINAIMLSGMLSRHTFVGHEDRALESIRKITDIAHRRGMKVIDHWDATLLWNIGEGFRTMTERTSDLITSVRGDVVSYQLCIMNPDMRRKLFDYARRDVAESGVDGLQIDEIEFWEHGCVCKCCREAFHRDTGWWMPTDETSPAWNDGTPFMKRWKAWRMQKADDFLVALRRSLKDVKPDLVISLYSTPNGLFTTYGSLGHGHDIMGSTRVANFFGTEVMARAILNSARAELPFHRTTAGAFTFAYGAPIWNWYYGQDWQNDYVSWALSEMMAQTPFLAEVDKTAETPNYPAFTAGMKRPGAKPVAEVALLFSSTSRNWNQGQSVKGDLLGTAQALEALHIPYAVISEVSLDAEVLKQFNVLFLGASHCMTDAQVAAVRTFAERGGTVRLSTLAAACDEFGERRVKWPFADVFGFEPRVDKGSKEIVERPCGKGRMIWSPAPRGEPFELVSLKTGTILNFNPDPREESEFRAEVAGWAGDAKWWDVSAPDKVYTSVWREKDGAIAVHFLNTTGENKKHGEKIVDAAPNPAFPQLKEDIVFTIPAAGATKATATSPEFSGERPLHVEPLPGGKVRVTVPKDLFSAYVFVRVK